MLDPKVRILAAPYADPHLFLDETDPDVVGAVIKGGLADDVCRERWTSPDKPFGVRSRPGRSSQTASRPTACSPR